MTCDAISRAYPRPHTNELHQHRCDQPSHDNDDPRHHCPDCGNPWYGPAKSNGQPCSCVLDITVDLTVRGMVVDPYCRRHRGS